MLQELPGVVLDIGLEEGKFRLTRCTHVSCEATREAGSTCEPNEGGKSTTLGTTVLVPTRP